MIHNYTVKSCYRVFRQVDPQISFESSLKEAISVFEISSKVKQDLSLSKPMAVKSSLTKTGKSEKIIFFEGLRNLLKYF